MTEKEFYDKSNFEMIYEVLDADMYRRSGFTLDELIINSREVIFNAMNKSYSNQKSLEDCNKDVLTACLPTLLESIPQVMIADEQINVFKLDTKQEIDDQTIQPYDNSSSKEIQIIKEEPSQSTTEIDLDVSSADRKEWTINSDSNNPYRFTVTLGSTATNPGISTSQALKNVIGMVVTHAILPDTSTYPLDKYPYLYLEIEELSGTYISTSNHGRRALVKLIRDKQWNENSTSNVRFNLMNTRGNGARPSVGFQTDTPISSLSRITIKILTPNGFPLQAPQDVFSFDELDNQSNTDQVTIQCTNTFAPNAVHVGNRIGFQTINDTSGSIITSEIPNSLRTFLENNEHEVIAVNNNQNITILAPIESYDASGIPQYTQFNVGLLTGLSNSMIMNYSIQSNFGFNVKTIKHKITETPNIV
jgi:hypothetical protein